MIGTTRNGRKTWEDEDELEDDFDIDWDD